MKHLQSETHDLTVFTLENKSSTNECLYTHHEKHLR